MDRYQSGEMLHLFNLLRLAILQEQLGLSKEERFTWFELLQALHLQQEKQPLLRVSEESIQAFLKHLQTEGITLLNYIKEREKILREAN